MYEYAPIVKVLHTLDETASLRTKHKFDIAYFIAKENMVFAKMGPLCQLEERHGVDLRQGYKNEIACSSFIDYIAQEQRRNLLASLSVTKFFGLQADGSTDAGNIEDKVILAVYCDPHTADGRVHVRSQFLSIRRPARAKKKLIGFGCDGASVNTGAHGLRGFLQALDYVFFFVLCPSLRASTDGRFE